MTHRPGDIIIRDGRLWRVGLVNACRMRLDPLEGRDVTICDEDGTVRASFQSYGTSLNVAPSTEYPIAPPAELARVTQRLARLMAREEKTDD